MIIMPSNNTGQGVRELFKKFPGKLALLQNPARIRHHAFLYPYAIDNAAFSQFDESQFFKMLDFSRAYNPPLFVVCPDVVGCHVRTRILWDYYYPRLKRYGYPIAFVCQDGCTPDSVPGAADWLFIGGLDPWKMQNAHKYIADRPVHVGRVNTVPRLTACENMGAESVDGTGWARFGKICKIEQFFNDKKEEQLCMF